MQHRDPVTELRPVRPLKLSGLSIVLPCFDEQDNVATAVREATAAAELVADAHEVIVVDDGSSDGTLDAALAEAVLDPRVQVVVHEHNRGYGAALRSGMGAARYEWVFLTDADLQFDLRDLRLFVPLTASHDLLMGFRMRRRDPWHRRVNARAWNWLVRQTLHVPVGDVDCAFKLIRRDVVERLTLTSDGATISPELVAKADHAGARICELGVHHRPRVAGRQSGANPRVVARAMRELRELHGELARTPAPAPAPVAAPQTRPVRT
jgi:glycosyltransferase involved in cell wall biosynthesis